jgi:hypothetical protein
MKALDYLGFSNPRTTGVNPFENDRSSGPCPRMLSVFEPCAAEIPSATTKCVPSPAVASSSPDLPTHSAERFADKLAAERLTGGRRRLSPADNPGEWLASAGCRTAHSGDSPRGWRVRSHVVVLLRHGQSAELNGEFQGGRQATVETRSHGEPLGTARCADIGLRAPVRPGSGLSGRYVLWRAGDER